jgi:hypothetical protein
MAKAKLRAMLREGGHNRSRNRLRPSARICAFGAIALISACNAARLSWIEAMTGPIGIPTSTSTASDKALIGFRGGEVGAGAGSAPLMWQQELV